MRVVWTPRAAATLARINDRIAEDSPQTAARVVRHIVDRTSDLAFSPYQGRVGRVKGTREPVVPRTPCIVVHRVNRAQVAIISVMHAAQRWPTRFPH